MIFILAFKKWTKENCSGRILRLQRITRDEVPFTFSRPGITNLYILCFFVFFWNSLPLLTHLFLLFARPPPNLTISPILGVKESKKFPKIKIPTLTCRWMVTAALSRVTSSFRSRYFFRATMPRNAACILLAAFTWFSSINKFTSLAGTLSNIFSCFCMDDLNSLILFCSRANLRSSRRFPFSFTRSLSKRRCLNFRWSRMIPNSACLRRWRCLEPR